MATGDDQFNVFLSWSGQKSKAIATAFKQLLTDCVPEALPWLSSDDIDKGSAWARDILDNLNSSKIGAIFVTKENQHEPWVLFEAGAINKGLQGTRTCTVLLDIAPPLTGPLGQFQYTLLEEEDIYKLILDIAKALEADRNTERIKRFFDKSWSDFDAAIAIMKKAASTPAKDDFDEVAATKEILSTVRRLDRHFGQPGRNYITSRHSLSENLRDNTYRFVGIKPQHYIASESDIDIIYNRIMSMVFEDLNANKEQGRGEITIESGSSRYTVPFSWQYISLDKVVEIAILEIREFGS